jgi:hypothetical protein
MDGARPELLALDPLWITNNQYSIVINIYQDSVARTHSNALYGQTGGALPTGACTIKLFTAVIYEFS